MAIGEWLEEWDVLRELIAFAAAGAGVVMVKGGLATGKSALLRVFHELASQAGMRTVGTEGARAEIDLPLGVLAQLIEGAELPDDLAAESASLLEEGMAGGEPRPQVVHRLCQILLSLTVATPLMICVDDVHLADDASLRCLLSLARRRPKARLLIVLAGLPDDRLTHGTLPAELRRLPRFHQFQLGVLPAEKTAALLRQEVGEPRNLAAMASHLQAMTGGNPLLIREVLADSQGPDGFSPTQLVAGERFREAVRTILDRGRPLTAQIAQGAAILGDLAAAGLLARLLEVDVRIVRQVLTELAEAGLVDGERLRHAEIRMAVCETIEDAQRLDLHRRAAVHLYRDAAPLANIVAHLVRAGAFADPWVVPVLQEAAAQALADSRADLAVGYLETAVLACRDERRRAIVLMSLARAQWNTDPAAVVRYQSQLVAAAQSGDLRREDGETLIGQLLWHGRLAEAADVMALLPGLPVRVASDPERYIDELWLASTVPSFTSAPVTADYPGADRRPPMSFSPTLRLAGGFVVVLASDSPADSREWAVADAEQSLDGIQIGQDNVGWVRSALLTLMYSGRLDSAEQHAEALARQLDSRAAPWWLAQLNALRGEIALRRGDLTGAARLARLALSGAEARTWGIAIGMPLGTLMFATALTGRIDEAAAQLTRPVADVLFQSRFGLHYLRGRGNYYLAAGRLEAALSDFLTCGSLMSRWGQDVPGLVPWRTEAARACLALGDHEQAGDLVFEQMSLLDGAGGPVRGICLRLLAATREPGERPALLRDAVKILQAGGERLELSRALDDLGQAHRLLGEPVRARSILRVAGQVAAECGVALSAPHEHPGRPSGPAPMPERFALSEAEWRVASLATVGHTNREIAGKLYISMSTVEQHLTHAYRKLQISSREELSSELIAGAHPIDGPWSPVEVGATVKAAGRPPAA